MAKNISSKILEFGEKHPIIFGAILTTAVVGVMAILIYPIRKDENHRGVVCEEVLGTPIEGTYIKMDKFKDRNWGNYFCEVNRIAYQDFVQYRNRK